MDQLVNQLLYAALIEAEAVSGFGCYQNLF